MNATNFFMDVAMFLFVIAFFLLGVLAHKSSPEYFERETYISTKIGSSCDNSSLLDASRCLTNELKSFWKYNITQIGKELTDKELMTSGGVCTHATQWYAERMKALGFYTKEVIIKTDNNSWHEFLIASDSHSYCLMDQTILNCYEFENNKSRIEVDLNG